MMNYDPNLTNSGRHATQIVRLVFGIWEYRGQMEIPVNGNCRGLTVIQSAVDSAYEGLPTDRMGTSSIILTKPDGTTLDALDEEEQGEDWLAEMLISAEIISIEPQTES